MKTTETTPQGPREPEIAQHTPGPWALREMTNGQMYVEHETADVDVAIVLNPYPMPGDASPEGGMTAQRLANARLIASAPELLAALRHIATYPNITAASMRDCARAAIAKAEGTGK